MIRRNETGEKKEIYVEFILFFFFFAGEISLLSFTCNSIFAFFSFKSCVEQMHLAFYDPSILNQRAEIVCAAAISAHGWYP